MSGSDGIIAEVKQAMRRLASTVTIISTANVNGNRYGRAAASVTSVSTDAPSLLICVNHGASIHAPLAGRDDNRGTPYLENAQCNLVCDVDTMMIEAQPALAHSA